MKRRMIDGGIWVNEKFAELPYVARLLQIGIINIADDQGRTKAHPAYLRSQLFPYDDVTLDDMRRWLQLMATNGTVILYQVDGKEYIQLVNWWEYQNLQYAAPSEYPRPDGWHDRIRYNGKGHYILTCNWTTVGGEQLEDLCDENGDPLPIVATLPPKNPGGRPSKNPGGNPPGNPPGNPGGNIMEEEINISINKDQEGEAETATQPALQERTPTPQQEMFGAVCEAIGWDYQTLAKGDKGQVAQAVKILSTADPPYTVEDIHRFMVDVWFKDWRWTKEQQLPNLKQLRQEIGKIRSMIPSVAPPPKEKGIDGYRAMLARQGIDL